jgi:hypothetical protein
MTRRDLILVFLLGLLAGSAFSHGTPREAHADPTSTNERQAKALEDIAKTLERKCK